MAEDISDALLSSEIKHTWRRWWGLFNELLAHAITILFVVFVIEAIDWFIHRLHGGDIVFFDKSSWEFPVKYLFQAADTAMIVSISIVALATVINGVRR